MAEFTRPTERIDPFGKDVVQSVHTGRSHQMRKIMEGIIVLDLEIRGRTDILSLHVEEMTDEEEKDKQNK